MPHNTDMWRLLFADCRHTPRAAAAKSMCHECSTMQHRVSAESCSRTRKSAFPCGAAVFQHLVKLFLGTASQHESSVFLHPFIACSAPASAFCLPALFLLLIICHGTHRDNYSPRRQAPASLGRPRSSQATSGYWRPGPPGSATLSCPLSRCPAVSSAPGWPTTSHRSPRAPPVRSFSTCFPRLSALFRCGVRLLTGPAEWQGSCCCGRAGFSSAGRKLDGLNAVSGGSSAWS